MAFLKRLNEHFHFKPSATEDGRSFTSVETARASDLPQASETAEEYTANDPGNDDVHSGDVECGVKTEKQCEGDRSLSRSNAKARVNAMRKALLPQSAREKVADVGASGRADGHAKNQPATFPAEADIHAREGLPALQADILWASVLPFRDSTGLDFVLATGMKKQGAFQQACVICETLYRQLTALKLDELLARIQRLERHLLYYQVDLYGAGEATRLVEMYNGRSIDADDDASHISRPSSKLQAALSTLRTDIEGRKHRYDNAAQEQKQSWRQSVPVGVDVGTLEKAWKLNSDHPIFERLSKQDENRFLECLNELTVKQKESKGNGNEFPHDKLEDDVLDSGDFLQD